MRRTKQKLESQFGVKRDTTHVTKNTKKHIWLIVNELLRCRNGKVCGLQEQPGRGTISGTVNLRKIGESRLSKIVYRFNDLQEKARDGRLEDPENNSKGIEEVLEAIASESEVLFRPNDELVEEQVISAHLQRASNREIQQAVIINSNSQEASCYNDEDAQSDWNDNNSSQEANILIEEDTQFGLDYSDDERDFGDSDETTLLQHRGVCIAIETIDTYGASNIPLNDDEYDPGRPDAREDPIDYESDATSELEKGPYDGEERAEDEDDDENIGSPETSKLCDQFRGNTDTSDSSSD
ncbi:hypothetical protein H2198_004726 [Neophaeococcomyces mojaviensis]|nr:hypothetical protein H2198_004726 [Knufia sp. JES_112]